PRNHRTGPKTVPKGYYRTDLEPVWQRHLPETQTKPEGWSAAPGCDEGILRSPVAAELQNSSLSTPKLTASSQKPVAPPVAADLQDSTLSRSRLEHLLRYQPKVDSSQKPGSSPCSGSNTG